jgi:hypothetical protein
MENKKEALHSINQNILKLGVERIKLKYRLNDLEFRQDIKCEEIRKSVAGNPDFRNESVRKAEHTLRVAQECKAEIEEIRKIKEEIELMALQISFLKRKFKIELEDIKEYGKED